MPSSLQCETKRHLNMRETVKYYVANLKICLKKEWKKSYLKKRMGQVSKQCNFICQSRENKCKRQKQRNWKFPASWEYNLGLEESKSYSEDRENSLEMNKEKYMIKKWRWILKLGEFPPENIRGWRNPNPILRTEENSFEMNNGILGRKRKDITRQASTN